MSRIRNAIIDPAPYRMNEEIGTLHREIDGLKREISLLRTYINQHMKKSEIEEPTL